MDNTEKLKKSFSSALGLLENEITEDLTYGSTKKWDSTAHMVLVANIEKQFDVMLDTMDVIDISSLSKCKEILIKYGITFT